MNLFRKVMLVLSCILTAVCCLFLNLMGGIAFIINNYDKCGISLLVSSGLLIIALFFAFFRNCASNLISLLFNAAGTILYIYSIGILNAIPDNQISKEAISVLTGRIYPAVSVTIALTLVIFADYFSYDRITQREQKRLANINEKQRALNENEKIV